MESLSVWLDLKNPTRSDSIILTRSFVRIPDAAELVKICFACSSSELDAKDLI